MELTFALAKWVTEEYLSQIDSTLRVKLTHIEIRIDSTLRVKSAKHWESIWLKIRNHVDSKLGVKLTQKWELSWLSNAGKFDSTLIVKLTQIFYSYLFC